MRIIKRFWKYVNKKGPDECWEWKAAKDGTGYGLITIKMVMHKAHRVSWAIAHHTWPIPNGFQINHTCDNRSCVNPAHLYLGTQQDNMQDRSSLTPDMVREIKRMRKAGYRQNFLAKKYGVSNASIHDICKGKRWSNIKCS